jgi:hypothetical protein
MVGFPGETREDVRTTFEFIQSNRDVIDTPFSSYSVSIFELREGIPVLEQSEHFQVQPRVPLRGELDDQYEFECDGGLTLQERINWRERFIRFSKEDLNMEIVCPQNKTHQLVLKDLYDQGNLALPVGRIEPAGLDQLTGRLTAGIEITRHRDSIHVLSHASGGELEVCLGLLGVFRGFQQGIRLDLACRLQSIWDGTQFARFVEFLYRNDYLVIFSPGM